ncbi:MAG: hypothetical protein NZT61_02970 [Deltaproteobacteria bacterium]|nr:hypothetical protein [Deltaproteobacteria bacterium]
MSYLRSLKNFLGISFFLLLKLSSEHVEFVCQANGKVFSEILGQNLVLGISGRKITEGEIRLIKKFKPAGFVLYSRNIAEKHQLQELTQHLQSLSFEYSNLPAFIMVDEEPGGATRFGLLTHVIDGGKVNWSRIVTGLRLLKDVGINVLLAPIADWSYKCRDAWIGKRLPFVDLNSLCSFNKNFITVAAEMGLLTTAKHFPGLGCAKQDVHFAKIKIEIPECEYFEMLKAFECIVDLAPMIMTSHALYPKVDRNIATISQKIIQDQLRNFLKFKGIVITDDLMDMLETSSIIAKAEIAKQAIIAGANLLTFSHRLELFEKIFEYLLGEEKNVNFKTAVEKNYTLICKFKREKLM